MTEATVSVTAEWALHGKTGADSEPGVLACSAGVLRRQHFAEVIDRFSPGTLSELPQVWVNYIRFNDTADDCYVALAFREFADDGRRDVDGRGIMFTRYFCAPYPELAVGAVTYHAMYEAFSGIRLPSADGPPLQVNLAMTGPRAPDDATLAQQAAALLLTGQAVCVLGAEQVSVPDRLRFIDFVMSLLPYGLRSRMSAATWTSGTARGHKFRLFFSNTPRGNAGHDHVLYWGEPRRTLIPDDPAVREYLDGPGGIRLAGALAGMTERFGFGAADVERLLAAVRGGLGASPGRRPPPARLSRPYAETVHGDTGLLHRLVSSGSDADPRAEPDGDASEGEETLLGCVRRLETGDVSRLKPDMATLRRHAVSDIAARYRERYCDIIRQHELLRPGIVDRKTEGQWYETLLRLAFGLPLSYGGYCALEDCLRVPPGQPHPALVAAIQSGGLADPVVAALVRHFTDSGHRKPARALDIESLIPRLAGDWPRVDHARIVCDYMLRQLENARLQDRRSLQPVFWRVDYLAPALQRRHFADPQYQVTVLTALVRALHGEKLDRRTAAAILADTGSSPTPALLAAVLLLLGDPGKDARLVREAFVTGTLTHTAFDVATQSRLSALMES